jgi:hypothetical protein
MSLPKIGTKEWALEVRFYQHASTESIRRKAVELGIKEESYRRIMAMRGIKRKGALVQPEVKKETPVVETEETPIIVNLPPLVLKKFVQKEKRNSEEIVALHMSDGHAGKITKSYDEDVYKQRMSNIFDSTMAIVSKHRKMYNISKLWIPNTGDNVQGENVYQGSKVGTIRLGARDQVTKLAFPAWAKLIASLKQEFEEVVFDGWPGNHGHNKLDPETSKEDLRLYDLLQTYFEGHKGITIRTHEAEVGDNIVNVLGFKFFCFHGDGIKVTGNLPFFAIEKRLKSWYMQFHGFNYALGGHFHSRHIDEISSECTYMMCSSLVSDDEWALKTLGISSNPSQNIFGIHHRRGISWNYALCVDDEFIPEKIPDKLSKEQRNANNNAEVKGVWNKSY